jgi:hypothetical protein
MQRCGSKNKQNGGTCENWVVRGRTRCRIHGGKSLVGTACPHYRSGRYSEYVPERLRARYEQAQDDPDLLSLRSEVALVDARLIDLLSRVDSGESGQLWADLKRAHQEFTAAKRGKDVARMQVTLTRVEYLIDSAVQDHQAWAEIGALIEQRRKLTESEAKRQRELQQMLTTEEALAMIRRLIDILTVHIPDRKILSAIIVDLQRMAGPPHALPAYAEDTDA